jgi:hypothetical protein
MMDTTGVDRAVIVLPSPVGDNNDTALKAVARQRATASLDCVCHSSSMSGSARADNRQRQRHLKPPSQLLRSRVLSKPAK